MAQKTRAVLKTYFETGDLPSEDEFADLIDSNLNLIDDLLIGTGDMLKSVYDTDNSGVVDNAETVNSLTVETAVPAGAVFTDTHLVDSVNTKTGAVVLQTVDIAENTNLYYTEGRVTANSSVAANTAKETNADHTGEVTGSGALTIASGVVDNDNLESTLANRITANDAKVTNVTTNLSLGAITGTTMIVASSDGTNATLIAADTDDAGLLTAAKFDEITANTAKAAYKTAASGLPSTSGAGDISMSRANDYYSETAITGEVTWGLTNIGVDKVMSVDMKTGVYAVNLVESGITFKGSINGSGVVQNLDATKSNLISIWAQTATIMWVTVIINEA